MTASMNAIRFYDANDVRVESVPRPAAGPHELLARVEACAVCGTDLKAFVHGNPRIKPPRIMGHEFCAIVETAGEKTGDFEPGDRIVMATSVSCGECYYCQRGWNNLCLNLSPMGFGYDGGMAEYVVIPRRALQNGHVIKAGKTTKPEHAALAEPISCAINACENSNLQQGDSVIVIGAGPMGIINACVAKQLGAQTVILAEVNETRLNLARQFDLDGVVNSATEDLEKIVMEQTGGLGADVAIVAAPSAEPQEQAIHLVRKRGTVCLFASLPADRKMINIDSRVVHYNELRIVGSSDSAPRHVQKAVELINTGALPLEKLASHIMPLEDIHKAFDLMKSGDALRVVLKP